MKRNMEKNTKNMMKPCWPTAAQPTAPTTSFTLCNREQPTRRLTLFHVSVKKITYEKSQSIEGTAKIRHSVKTCLLEENVCWFLFYKFHSLITQVNLWLGVWKRFVLCHVWWFSGFKLSLISHWPQCKSGNRHLFLYCSLNRKKGFCLVCSFELWIHWCINYNCTVYSYFRKHDQSLDSRT